MLEWIDFLTAVVVLVTWLTYVPLIGTNPSRWRDYTVWSAYLTVATLVANWTLSTVAEATIL